MGQNTKLFFALMLLFSAATQLASAQQTASDARLTRAEVRRMVREAHTVDQYSALADYYATAGRMYKRKAAEEMHLWAERSAMINPLSEKWPRPVDSARNLHDYYEYKANQAFQLQTKYSKLADELAAK